MFEIVMLTGFLIAAVSQFLPEEAGGPEASVRPGKRKNQEGLSGKSG